MQDYGDVVILDDEDFDDEDFRNQRRDHRTTVRIPSSRPGGRPRRPTAIVRPSRGTRIVRRPPNVGPVVRTDTGGLSYGVLIEAGAQVLAAIQPLPAPPVATGRVEIDVGNLMLYQQALAEHAKRDEQLRTVGSLANKLFA